MKYLFKNILTSIGGAFLLLQAQELLGTKYIIEFLDDNLVSLLIALLAINSASLGIVLSKIRELIDSDGTSNNFTKTKNEMFFSIKEQIFLIFFSLVLLMINDSVWLTKYPTFIPLMEMGIITCFTYAMIVLFDAAKSIFVVLSFNK